MKQRDHKTNPHHTIGVLTRIGRDDRIFLGTNGTNGKKEMFTMMAMKSGATPLMLKSFNFFGRGGRAAFGAGN